MSLAITKKKNYYYMRFDLISTGNGEVIVVDAKEHLQLKNG